MEQYILRLPEVKARSGLARSTIYKYIANGLWTKPVRLGGKAVGWPKYEIDKLITARISGKDDLQIKEMVKDLEILRQHACSEQI